MAMVYQAYGTLEVFVKLRDEVKQCLRLFTDAMLAIFNRIPQSILGF